MGIRSGIRSGILTAQGRRFRDAHRFSDRTGRRLLVLATIGVVAQTWAARAAADDSADVPAAREQSQVETITVTARRRAEDSQDVPIPIATLSGREWDDTGQVRLEDLNQHLPSTNVQFANPRQSSIAVRGLGNNPANDALESSVGVYIDDVYLGRPGMANQDLTDIDQISLLRGPQGTLYGKNTTAGVLNIVTRPASFTPEGSVEATAGEYGDASYYQVRSSITGPLIDDELAGRIAFSKTMRDGFLNDVTDGRNLNEADRQSERGELLYTPTESLKVRIIGDYSTEDSDCCASVLYNPGPNGGALFYSKVAAAGGDVVYDKDYDKVTIDTRQHMKVRQGGGSVQVDYSFADYDLTSITAYRGWNFWPTNDGDSTSISAVINAGQHVDDSQWSQELRLASANGGPVDWVAGLYYFYQTQDNSAYAQYGPDAGAYLGRAVLNNGYSLSHQDLNTDSYSGFGQATWHVTDRFDVTAGIRQTYERKTARVIRDVATGNPTIGLAFPAYDSGTLDVSTTRPSGLVSASYKITDDVLVYSSLSSGAKAGGINPIVPAAGLGTDSLFIEPEKAKDAELGVKTTLFERRVQLNANVFWTNVEDYQATLLVQTTPGVFSQVLSNIGKVQTRGWEVEATAIPFDGLSLSLTGSFNDATYESYENAPCPAEAALTGQTVCNLTGNPVVGAPRWIANPSVSYEHPIGHGLTLHTAWDYAWRSNFYGAPDNSTYSKIDAYGVLNARLGVSGDFEKTSWDLTFWAQNLLDESYVVGGLGAGNYGSYFEYPGQPRSYGATVRVGL